MGVLTLRPDVEIDGNNLVDISFHDNAGLVGGRRPITFTDNVGFILGTLGDEGGLFASDLMEEEDDDDEFDEDGLTAGLSEATRKAVKRSRKKLNGHDSAKGSSVYFHRFDTFGKTSDKDWVYALPDGERVLGCATGSGWCGVMTR
jgi:chromosome transmission fidelity protein 4